jgi:hypothetical protein
VLLLPLVVMLLLIDHQVVVIQFVQGTTTGCSSNNSRFVDICGYLCISADVHEWASQLLFLLLTAAAADCCCCCCCCCCCYRRRRLQCL